ncbi:hypothetical protein BAE44_0010323 [Dichanthelium oligosanthes]|uniref:DUF1618 domain-containing protein n=1 Tax=Dichanthelium oligosanthes TaxID=888268 RepID=A0A1E5VU91_9POAL|nr:hypothetical protein BAE44_0010323 [Dichanthelium oligosanthes]
MPDDDDSGNVPRSSSWETDAAFSFGGLVYWADYHRGVLSCDVAAADPELRFVPFPRVEIPEDDDIRYGDRVLPERYRTASVDSGVVLRFVDVDDSRDSSGEWGCVVIRTWSLRTPALGWEEEHAL